MERDTKRWFSVPDAAAYCGYRSPRQIYAAIRERELAAYNRSGRGGFRIYREDLDAWLMAEPAEKENECK